MSTPQNMAGVAFWRGRTQHQGAGAGRNDGNRVMLGSDVSNRAATRETWRGKVLRGEVSDVANTENTRTDR